MILLIDNYDSFAHNLARYLKMLSGDVQVVRNDDVRGNSSLVNQCDAIVISPGPCSPLESGNTLEIVNSSIGRVPLLGICLGHQAIVHALGGKVVRAAQPVHGCTSRIFHDAEHEFQGLPNPFDAARYHSLIAENDSLPSTLKVTAWTADETIMAVRHREEKVFGWQFHPESILTEIGLELLAAFLRESGLPCTRTRKFAMELPIEKAKQQEWPDRPITF